MSSTPVVLVHGSYHQPAQYGELISRLAADTGGVSVPETGMLPLTQSIPLVQDIVDQGRLAPGRRRALVRGRGRRGTSRCAASRLPLGMGARW